MMNSAGQDMMLFDEAQPGPHQALYNANDTAEQQLVFSPSLFLTAPYMHTPPAGLGSFPTLSSSHIPYTSGYATPMSEASPANIPVPQQPSPFSQEAHPVNPEATPVASRFPKKKAKASTSSLNLRRRHPSSSSSRGTSASEPMHRGTEEPTPDPIEREKSYTHLIQCCNFWQREYKNLQAQHETQGFRLENLQHQTNQLKTELAVMQRDNGYLKSLNSWLPLIQMGARCEEPPAFHPQTTVNQPMPVYTGYSTSVLPADDGSG